MPEVAKPAPVVVKPPKKAVIDLSNAPRVVAARFATNVQIKAATKGPGVRGGSPPQLHTAWDNRSPERMGQEMYQHAETAVLYLFDKAECIATIYPSQVTFIELAADSVEFLLP